LFFGCAHVPEGGLIQPSHGLTQPLVVVHGIGSAIASILGLIQPSHGLIQPLVVVHGIGSAIASILGLMQPCGIPWNDREPRNFHIEVHHTANAPIPAMRLIQATSTATHHPATATHHSANGASPIATTGSWTSCAWD